MIVVLYVDNLVMIGNHEEKISQMKQMMSGEFEMTYFGLMHFYLGIEVWQESDKIFISQQKYIGEIPKAFSMAKCKSVATPMEVGMKLSMEDSSPLMAEAMYKRLVGSLTY